MYCNHLNKSNHSNHSNPSYPGVVWHTLAGVGVVKRVSCGAASPHHLLVPTPTGARLMVPLPPWQFAAFILLLLFLFLKFGALLLAMSLHLPTVLRHSAIPAQSLQRQEQEVSS